MPIVRSPDAGSPLSQGDILSGINLYATKDAHAPDGGESAEVAEKLCLVISRPCVAAHKATVIVAAVARWKANPPRDLAGFDAVRIFLTKYRDGHGSPDIFYLGQLPGRELEGRFAARLDSLHTIQVPQDDQACREFLATRRLYTLTEEFARDLHVRLFGSFASLGFDDHAWFATEDLEWLVREGQSELQAARAKETGELAKQAKHATEGGRFEEKPLNEARRTIEALVTALHPYEQELSRRRSPQAG